MTVRELIEQIKDYPDATVNIGYENDKITKALLKVREPFWSIEKPDDMGVYLVWIASGVKSPYYDVGVLAGSTFFASSSRTIPTNNIVAWHKVEPFEEES